MKNQNNLENVEEHVDPKNTSLLLREIKFDTPGIIHCFFWSDFYQYLQTFQFSDVVSGIGI